MLIPRGLRDVLLSVAAVGVFRPVWQEEIESEVERNSIKIAVRHGDGEAAATLAVRRAIRSMRVAFPGGCLDRVDWEPLVAGCTNDPKDRHVLAAALAAGATHVVTSNVRDFPVRSRPDGVSAMRPDSFLLQCLSENEEGVVAGIKAMAARHRAPPTTAEALAERIAKGVMAPRFGQHLVEVLAHDVGG